MHSTALLRTKPKFQLKERSPTFMILRNWWSLVHILLIICLHTLLLLSYIFPSCINSGYSLRPSSYTPFSVSTHISVHQQEFFPRTGDVDKWESTCLEALGSIPDLRSRGWRGVRDRDRQRQRISFPISDFICIYIYRKFSHLAFEIVFICENFFRWELISSLPLFLRIGNSTLHCRKYSINFAWIEWNVGVSIQLVESWRKCSQSLSYFSKMICPNSKQIKNREKEVILSSVGNSPLLRIHKLLKIVRKSRVWTNHAPGHRPRPQFQVSLF